MADQKVFILNIGDELLIGQVINSNAAWIAEQMSTIGYEVVEHRVIGDGVEDIRNALNEAFEKSNIILITGGLGPTRDDVTKKVLSDYFGTELEFDEDVYQNICDLFEKLGKTPTDAHRLQAYMPVDGIKLTNKLGTAPGMWFEKQDKVCVSLPGVPYEMKYIVEEQVLEKLTDYFDSASVVQRTILTAGEGESWIAEKISDIEDGLPDYIKLAYLPNLAKVRLRLTGKHENKAKLTDEINAIKSRILERLGDLVFGFDKDSLALCVQRLAIEKEVSVVTAESCTGGLIANLLTSEPGSSDFFKGSVVAYSNEVKSKVLGVNKQTLESYGAVSEETVQAMVNGVLNHLEADVAVAVSGIAGPGGGSKDKPVGTIWIAVGNRDRIVTKKLFLQKNRALNIEYSANTALNMIRHFLMEF